MVNETSREDAFDHSGAVWAFVALGAATSVAARVTGEEMAVAICLAALLVACAAMTAAVVLYSTMCLCIQAGRFLLRWEMLQEMPLMRLWDDKVPHGVKGALAVAFLATASWGLGMFMTFVVLNF